MRTALARPQEFLGAARGRLPPVRRNLVTQVFKVLDSVNPDGVLTVEDIEKAYSTSQHPEVTLESSLHARARWCSPGAAGDVAHFCR